MSEIDPFLPSIAEHEVCWPEVQERVLGKMEDEKEGAKEQYADLVGPELATRINVQARKIRMGVELLIRKYQASHPQPQLKELGDFGGEDDEQFLMADDRAIGATAMEVAGRCKEMLCTMAAEAFLASDPDQELLGALEAEKADSEAPMLALSPFRRPKPLARWLASKIGRHVGMIGKPRTLPVPKGDGTGIRFSSD
jgi:hypothetical protein